MPPRIGVNGDGTVAAAEVAVGSNDASSLSKDEALFKACWDGDAALVARLITEFGANVAAKDNTGRNPLHIAARRNHVDVVRTLVRDFGANVGAQNGDGWTPLFFAAHCGHSETVRMLVGEFGADESAKAEVSGLTPLHVAVQLNRLEAARVLVEEFGADVNAKLANSNTPM